MSFNTSHASSSVNENASFVSTVWLALRRILIARACVYCTYGPVSPSNCTTSSSAKSKLFVRSFFKSWKITAPTPTACATASLFSSDGFFASICFKASSVASFNTPSRRMIFPLRVDNFLPFNVISPNGICTISSDQGKFNSFKTAFNCLKWFDCSIPTT